MNPENWDNDRYEADIAYEIGMEKRTNEVVGDVIDLLLTVARPIWHQGDGFGGVVLEMLLEAAEERGMPTERSQPRVVRPKRRALSHRKTAMVYARDGLRCVSCRSIEDLTIDHIQPVSKGGTNDLENLQTLCRPCNSTKGDRWPN